MKKLIALLLVLVMIFSLAACGNRDDDDDDCKHKDKDGDGYCDKCDEEMEDETVEVEGTQFLGNVLSQFANAKTAHLSFTVKGDITQERWVNYDVNHNYIETPRELKETRTVEMVMDIVVSLVSNGKYNAVIKGVQRTNSNSSDDGINNWQDNIELYIIDGHAYEYEASTNTHQIYEYFDHEGFNEFASKILSNPDLADKDLADALSQLSDNIYKSFTFKNSTGKLTVDLKPAIVNALNVISDINSDTVVSEAMDKLLALVDEELKTENVVSTLEEYADLTVKNALIKLSGELEKISGISLKAVFEGITSNEDALAVISEMLKDEFGEEAYEVAQELSGMTFEEAIDKMFDTDMTVYELFCQIFFATEEDYPEKSDVFNTLRDMLALTVGDFEAEIETPVFTNIQKYFDGLEINALSANLSLSLTKKGEIKSLSGNALMDFVQNTTNAVNNQPQKMAIKYDINFELSDISSTAKSISLPNGSTIYEDINVDYVLFDQNGSRIGEVEVRFDGTVITLDEGIEINTQEYDKQGDGKTLIIPGARVMSAYVLGNYVDPDHSYPIYLTVDPQNKTATIKYEYLNYLRSSIDTYTNFTGNYSIYDEYGYYKGTVSMDSAGFGYIELSENNVRFEGNATLDRGNKTAIFYSENITYAAANGITINNYGGRFVIYYDFANGYAMIREYMDYTIPVNFTGCYDLYDQSYQLIGEVEIYDNGYGYVRINENGVCFAGTMWLNHQDNIAELSAGCVDSASAGTLTLYDYSGSFLINYNFADGYAVLVETMSYTFPDVDYTGYYHVFNDCGTLLGYLTVNSDGSAWFENHNNYSYQVILNMGSYNMLNAVDGLIAADSSQILAFYDRYTGSYLDLYGSTVYFDLDTSDMSAVMDNYYVEQIALIRNTTNRQFEILSPDNTIVGYVSVYSDQSSKVTIFGSDFQFDLPAFDYINDDGTVYFDYNLVTMYYGGEQFNTDFGMTYTFDFAYTRCYADSPNVNAAIFASRSYSAYDTYGNYVGTFYVDAISYNSFTVKLEYNSKNCYIWATDIYAGIFDEVNGFTVYSDAVRITPYYSSDRVNQPYSNMVVTYDINSSQVIIDYKYSEISVW